MKKQPVVDGAPKIAEEALESREVGLPGIVYTETDLLHGERCRSREEARRGRTPAWSRDGDVEAAGPAGLGVAGRVGCASMGVGARGFWRLQARALLGVGVAGRLGAALADALGVGARRRRGDRAQERPRGRVVARLLLACRGARSRGAGAAAGARGMADGGRREERARRAGAAPGEKERAALAARRAGGGAWR
jgi:hypothetical protein